VDQAVPTNAADFEKYFMKEYNALAAGQKDMLERLEKLLQGIIGGGGGSGGGGGGADKPAPKPTPAPTPKPAAGGEKIPKIDWDGFVGINKMREEGFSCTGGSVFAPNPVPLVFDCPLWKASQLHSQDMADNGYFAHNSQDGRSPWDRAKAQGTSGNGENIAAGSSTAEGALKQWHKSDGHCKNMGNPRFKTFAVGHASNEGSRYKHYHTQMFSSRGGTPNQDCLPAQSGTMGINSAHDDDDDAADLTVGSGPMTAP
jgi:hypothetical protein